MRPEDAGGRPSPGARGRGSGCVSESRMTSGSPLFQHLLDSRVLAQVDAQIAEAARRRSRRRRSPRRRCSRTRTMETRSTFTTSAMRWTTVKRMPRKSRFDASACVSSRRLRVLVLALQARPSPCAGGAGRGCGPRARAGGRACGRVVGAGLEGLRDLRALASSGGEHHDGHVARLRARAEDAEDLIAVRRRHHEVEEHERRTELRRPARWASAAGGDGHVRLDRQYASA